MGGAGRHQECLSCKRVDFVKRRGIIGGLLEVVWVLEVLSIRFIVVLRDICPSGVALFFCVVSVVCDVCGVVIRGTKDIKSI